MAAAGTSAEQVAQATFSLANNIQEVRTAPRRPSRPDSLPICSLTPALVHEQTDELYKYDKDAQKAQLNARAWKENPHHFKKVRISAVALIKMVSLLLSRQVTPFSQFLTLRTSGIHRSCMPARADSTKSWA